METCEQKLQKLKNLFSQFKAAVNDFKHNTNAVNSDAGQEIAMDTSQVVQYQKVQETPTEIMSEPDVNPIEPNCTGGIAGVDENLPMSHSNIVVIPAVQAKNIMGGRSVLSRYHFDQYQNVQETLDDRRANISPELNHRSVELSWTENIAGVPMSHTNIVVIPAVQANGTVSGQSESSRQHFDQHQKFQETPTDIMWELGANPIELGWTGNIVRVDQTFPISPSNIVVIPAEQANNMMSGRIESSGFQLNEVGTAIPMQKRHASTQQQNLEQEGDDYDEGVFQSFVENIDDLDDIEFCFEGHNNLPSIIETLAERKSYDTISSPNNEGPSQCESTPAVTPNHLELSAKRLIGSSDNTKMFVRTSDQKGKKLCCPFCYKLVCKLTRHVEDIHTDEAVVQKLIAIPKGPTFKKQKWILQNSIKVQGLLKWNTDPSVNTTGELIVSRRPNARLNRKATDFLICPNCTSFHTITNLRNHFARCTGGVLKGARNIKILARVIEGRLSQNASEQLRDVFPVMRDDEIVQLIRYDWLLIAYGNILCMKYGFHFQQNMIRAKLRLAGRVLHALKNINSEVTDFASIFYPKRYKSLIEAIKIVGKFDSVKNEFGAPATAASAITSIKQIGSILKCEYIEKENSEQEKRTDAFLFLMESQLTSIINKRVKENQLTKKRMKDHKIPSKEDVRLLSVFVNRERNKCLQELSASFSFESWKKLSELTIASIIVFNRKRVGETQNTIIEDFEHRQSIDETTNEDLYAALSEDSKKVAKSYSRMKVRGKKGILNVTVLLDADTTHCIEVMLSHRVEAGVPSYNECLFALPSPPGEKRVNVINACKVLSSLSKMCGAKDPTTLRGTNLRKHFATACMAKELNDDMVGEVAKFLGHSESVHREHYRHNTLDREVVKIAKLLQEAQGMDANEDDASDSESADTDVEDYVTIPESAFLSVSNESRNIHKSAISGRKQKKNLSEVQPSNSSATSSSAARQKGVRTGKNVQSEKSIAKRMKTERKCPKTKLGAATSSITGSKSAGRKRVKTEKEKHTEKVISKRTKTEGKVSNKLNAATSPVTSSKSAGGKRVRTECNELPENTFKRMKTKG